LIAVNTLRVLGLELELELELELGLEQEQKYEMLLLEGKLAKDSLGQRAGFHWPPSAEGAEVAGVRVHPGWS
jgi:hypothetical protein